MVYPDYYGVYFQIVVCKGESDKGGVGGGLSLDNGPFDLWLTALTLYTVKIWPRGHIWAQKCPNIIFIWFTKEL